MAEKLTVSIILPARNEAPALASLISKLNTIHPEAEIIVVDDGSTDNTAKIASELGTTCVSHPYSRGNGAAIKTGARAATGDLLVFMDADGQHNPADIHKLLDKIAQGYDLVVGSRKSRTDQASLARWSANRIYNFFASWMVGHRIEDLTSGFRAVRAELFREFLTLLPNGFSYPTTSTMAFFKAGYGVGFVPIKVAQRNDEKGSHIKLVKDGTKFFLIIFRVGTLYSPLKVFVPLSAFFFMCGGLYFSYTMITLGRFTNFGGILFISSILIFLIGLVSEQITQLLYSNTSRIGNSSKTRE